jgi:hypothetical protein
MKTGVWFARFVVLPVQAGVALLQLSAAALALLVYDSITGPSSDPALQPIARFCVRVAAVFLVSGFAALFLALRLAFPPSARPPQRVAPPLFRALFALGLVTLAALLVATCWPVLELWIFTGQLLQGLGLINTGGAAAPAAAVVAGLLLSFPAAATLAALSSVLFGAFAFTLLEEPRRTFLAASYASGITPLSFVLAAWFARDLAPHLESLLSALDPRFAWKSFVLEWARVHHPDTDAIVRGLTLLIALFVLTLVFGAWYRLRRAAEEPLAGIPAPHVLPNLSLLSQPSPADGPPPGAPVPPAPLLGPEWRFDAYQILPGRILAPAFFDNAREIFTFDNALFQMRQSGPLLDASGAPVLHIAKRALSGAVFEIDDAVTKARLGSFERGAIHDASGTIVGRVQELERNENIARYQLWFCDKPAAFFTHYPGLANSELDADFSADAERLLDRRLGIALALILRSRTAPSQ